MQKEVWKDINGYEGLYQVSNLGRVKSLYDARHKKFRELIMTPNMNTKGYFRVDLYKEGKHKCYRISRLVAIAFIPNPENLPEVNHKDEDKTNNCVWNLEWCDGKYNSNYGTRNKRVSEALKGIFNTKCSKSVLQLDKNTGEVIKEWSSTMEVQRQLGYANQNISNCCNGKYKSSQGFKWRYS